MNYLLDTNPCIQYLNGRSESLRKRIDGARDEQIAICSVVKAELFFGALKSRDPERVLACERRFLARFVSLPFDDDAAEAYGTIRANLEREGIPIGANDLMIAAIAVVRKLVLVTHNVREFGRVAGLVIEDWEAAGDE
jgi:tRNA(fMet)-specific endonuclease VapC